MGVSSHESFCSLSPSTSLLAPARVGGRPPRPPPPAPERQSRVPFPDDFTAQVGRGVGDRNSPTMSPGQTGGSQKGFSSTTVPVLRIFWGSAESHTSEGVSGRDVSWCAWLRRTPPLPSNLLFCRTRTAIGVPPRREAGGWGFDGRDSRAYGRSPDPGRVHGPSPGVGGEGG